jgi:hypothetical protein
MGKTYCHICKRTFATKYVLEKHMSRVHAGEEAMSDSSEEEETKSSDSKNSYGSPRESDSEHTNKSSDEDIASDAESDDFWKFLIRETVMALYSERVQEGLAGPLPDVENVEDLLGKPFLPAIMKRMRERFTEIEEVGEAAENDKLIHVIKSKAKKVFKQFKGENFKDEGNKIAWKKCKLLVKKKIEDNLDELKPLVEFPNSGSDSDLDSTNC